MQVATLNIFGLRPACVHNVWRLSDDGIMLIEGPDGLDLPFPPIRAPYDETPAHQVFNCVLESDGILRKDRKKIANKNMGLLLVVAAGEIVLPDHLISDHRVKIDPVWSKDGSLMASVVCFLKNEELTFVIRTKQEEREILFSYNKRNQFPEIMEITLPADLNPSSTKKTWQSRLREGFSLSWLTYFHPFRS